MRALITGRRGSCAYYLSDYLQSRGDEVHYYGERPREDMLELAGLMSCIASVRPEVVFHLASIANVALGWEKPAHVIGNNLGITVRLFEALDKLKLRPVVVLCSTSEVYGNNDHSPLGEDFGFNPVNPYAASKCAQEHVATMYAASCSIPLVITRAFGYINPRRADLALTSWARQIAQIEAGVRAELLHGQLASVRTFCDVRDIVRGYAYAADLGGGVYNIGSEEPMSLNQMLVALQQVAGVSVPLRLDPQLVRRVDIKRAIPWCGRFRQASRWEPVIALGDSLRWLMLEARTAIAKAREAEPA